jgi:hypothetical protein
MWFVQPATSTPCSTTWSVTIGLEESLCNLQLSHRFLFLSRICHSAYGRLSIGLCVKVAARLAVVALLALYTFRFFAIPSCCVYLSFTTSITADQLSFIVICQVLLRRRRKLTWIPGFTTTMVVYLVGGQSSKAPLPKKRSMNYPRSTSNVYTQTIWTIERN